VPRPLAWLGKFHPPLTHFPIALLTAAALAELIRMRRPSVLLHHAVRFCVGLGAGGALAAAVLGWLFAGFRVADDEWVMTAHRWVGSATALSAVIVFVLCERSYAAGKPSGAFRMALFAEAILVATTGFLGGSLIYGLDHYAW
jgi:uncharacterized membrane protein